MTAAIPPADGALLARLAARVVQARLTGSDEPVSVEGSPYVRRPGASFVTLERRGALRGCVGSLVPVRPLYRDVERNAVRAMADPRLPPVTVEDWGELDVKVSVLGPEEPIEAAGRPDLIAALRPGVDGLVLTDGTRRATFLPAVWAKLADPERFVDALLVKGGWPARSWPAGLTASRYTSAEFHDPAPVGGRT